jgi:hypothetical protein
MPNDDRLASSGSPGGVPRWGFILAAVLGALAIAATVVALARQSGSSAPDSTSGQAPSSLAVTTTSLAERDAVISRLRDILEERDRAYRERTLLC